MKVADFDYGLPEELIAERPPEVRGESRLLVLNRESGAVEDRKYGDVVDYLEAGDVLVLNDTRVIKSRLIAVKENGAERELMILEKHGEDTDWHHHRVLYHGHISAGDVLGVGEGRIIVEQIVGGGIAEVKSDVDLLELAEKYGNVPLPPYIKREATEEDVRRYQTLWARDAGSAAAPTASLNMTDEMLERLRAKGVRICYLTLHVGLGTFLPIRTEEVESHQIHTEFFDIPAETVRAVREAKTSGGRVVALGTTVTRTLEFVGQRLFEAGADDGICGEANIYIYPGYRFGVVDVMMTNFHAPKSTVLMMAAAFAGWENLREAYQHAVAERYKFLSYGDTMLIVGAQK